MGMRQGFDIVVIGGCNFDYLVRGPKIPSAGETAEGNEFQEAPGGKGANQAIGAARLAARVAFIARVGVDARGEACLKRLREENVDVEGVGRDSDSHTGLALIMVDEGGRKQIMTAPGANRRLTAADVRTQQVRLQAAKVALAQLEVPLDAIKVAFELCREAGAKTVIDPAPAVPLPDDLLCLVDVIRPNASEAEILTGIHVSDRTSALRAARALIERGVKAAIVQAGDEGDLAVWAGSEQWLPKLKVNSVDATGAGDAFAAALAVQLAANKSLPQAAIFANAAAALATTKLGAQAGLPTTAAVEGLLASAAQQ